MKCIFSIFKKMQFSAKSATFRYPENIQIIKLKIVDHSNLIYSVGTSTTKSAISLVLDLLLVRQSIFQIFSKIRGFYLLNKIVQQKKIERKSPYC